MIFFLIFFLILFIACKPKSEYKIIDFGSFKITVPENWNKIEIHGTDSYVGGIETNIKDTLLFDLGPYSSDITKNDSPLVFDKKSYSILTKKQKILLKRTNHLIVDSISRKINFENYLKQKSEMMKIDCFNAKLITPKNKEFGVTGIYIDNIKGNQKNSNIIRFSFYGENLKEITEKEFVKSLKSIKLKECYQ